MPVVDLTPPKICQAVTIPPIPSLPTSISLTLALPVPITPFPVGVKLCCYSVQFDPTSLIPPIPIVSASLASSYATLLNQIIALLNTYIRALPVLCPKGDAT